MYTLETARELVLRDDIGASFVDEVAPDQNVLVLVKRTDHGGWYSRSYATVVGPVPSGRIRVKLYVSGDTTALVQRNAIYTADCPWCRGEATALVVHCGLAFRGEVFDKRRCFGRLYGEEPTEAEVLTDYKSKPSGFTERPKRKS